MKDGTIDTGNMQKDAEGVFTFVETSHNKIAPVSLEILAVARKLADKLNTFVASILIGCNKEDLERNSKELVAYGADKVILIFDERLDFNTYFSLPFTRALYKVIEAKKPEIFLFGATTTGRDLAPRTAARCNVGLSADCTEFDIDDYYHKKTKITYRNVANFIRPSFAEAKLATIIGNPRMWRYPQMGTARPGTFKPLSPDFSREGTIEFAKILFPPEDFNIKVLERVEETKEFVDFDRAKIIVSGGAGVGQSGFKLLEKLVQAINDNGQHCELGASRSAVDAGWIRKSHQIGQTGRTVRPEIYIAIGISGAIQHIEGMKNSRVIIAVNSDPNASIFNYADIGIVEEYEKLLQALTKEIKEGYRFPDVF
jgi:electron transfer flavoprotein alpha subunit